MTSRRRSTSSATSCWDSASVALFVSIFIIYNTFAIVLGQRTRELALLRTIGADPGRSGARSLGEALVDGRARLGRPASPAASPSPRASTPCSVCLGVDLSHWPIILATRTLIAAAVTGIGVTLLGRLGAGTTGLHGAADRGPYGARRGRRRPSRKRVIAGGALVAGLARRVAGRRRLDRGSRSPGSAFGAMAIFLGVTC